MTAIDGGLSALWQAITLPGRLALFFIVEYLPDTAEFLDIGYGDEPLLLTFMLSLGGWFFALLGLMLVRALARNLARSLQAWALTLWNRTLQWLQGLRTIVRLRLRQWFPNRFAIDCDETVEFSELDISILTSAWQEDEHGSVTPHGIATAFGANTNQVQRSLEKLCRHGLVAANDNSKGEYLCTDSGNAYRLMLQQHTA